MIQLKICIVLYFFLLLNTIGEPLLVNSLNKRLANDQSIRLSTLSENVGEPIAYSFSGEKCVQISSVGSSFSNALIKKINNLNRAPAILITKGSNECNNYLIIAEKIDDIFKSLMVISMWASNRIVACVHTLSKRDENRLLQVEKKNFRDAEILIVAAQNFSQGYRMDQPLRQFERVVITDQVWTRKYDGIHKFFGREIVMSTKNFSIYTKVWPGNKDNRTDKLEGVELNIFKEIIKRMNLTCKLSLATEGIGKKVDGRWSTGVLGEVAQNRADLGIRGLWISMDKVASGVDMSAPLRSIRVIYLVPRPKRLLGQWYGVFQSFHQDIWIFIGVSLMFYSVSLYAVEYFTDILLNKLGKGSNTFLRVLLQIYGMLVLGSWPKVNRTQNPTRLLLMWWAIFALLLTTSFSSSLISKLTTPTFSRSINTVEEFLHEDYEWTLRKNVSLDILFNTNDQVHKRWLERIKYVTDVTEYNHIIKGNNREVILGYEINNSFHLFDDVIEEETLLKYETTHEYFLEFYLAFALRQGSIFNQGINRYIRYFRESGLIGYIINNEVRRKAILRTSVYSVRNHVRHAGIDSHRHLTLLELKGVFVLLMIGLMASAIVAFLEKIFFVPITEKPELKCNSVQKNKTQKLIVLRKTYLKM